MHDRAPTAAAKCVRSQLVRRCLPYFVVLLLLVAMGPAGLVAGVYFNPQINAKESEEEFVSKFHNLIKIFFEKMIQNVIWRNFWSNI